MWRGHASWFRGRAIRDGVDLDALDGPSWVDVIWSLALDYIGGGALTPMGAASKFDEVFEWGSPLNPDFEMWGETESAKAGAAAMVQLAGGLPRQGATTAE